MLIEREHRTTLSSRAYALATFQQEAVSRARSIIETRNGVIIADSVGLGKTFVAAALMEATLDRGGTCALVIPAALRSMWRNALRPLMPDHRPRITVLTHTQLSRGHVFSDRSLVVVDEAHAFRTPQTRRYRALRRSSRASRVVLLTATPVNNSLSDLYFQLRLFACDDAFRDIGIGSLAALLTADDPPVEAIARLRDAVIIRRTRSDVRSRFGDTVQLADGTALRFPLRRELVQVQYPPPLSVASTGRAIADLSFGIYRDRVTPLLVRLSLLKRFQSSRHAFAVSIERLIALHERFIAALACGRLLVPGSASRETEQLFFPEIILDEVPIGISTRDLVAAAETDLHTLRALHGCIAQAKDTKLEPLIDLLEARREARTLVFTEFKDTARHLWEALQFRFQVALITGDEARLGSNAATRVEIIRRFAPLANGVPASATREAVHVLIATDVLAEGLNLQDADAVVSYDLPWNPVRMVQRAGRIDRIGSDHDLVKVYNFMPDREFDVFLGLVRILRNKLAQMRSAVGQESPVLDPGELDLAFVADLAGGRKDLLDEDRTSIADMPNETEAGPYGSVSCWSAAQASLLCWTRNGSVRELVVEGATVSECPELADTLIRSAMHDHEARACDPMPVMQMCREYLEADQSRGLGQESVAAMSVEIRRAVMRLGLLVTPDLISAGDEVLQSLPGFLGSWRAAMRALRAAATPQMLLDALAQIRADCTVHPPESPAEWTLIAAIISASPSMA